MKNPHVPRTLPRPTRYATITRPTSPNLCTPTVNRSGTPCGQQGPHGAMRNRPSHLELRGVATHVHPQMTEMPRRQRLARSSAGRGTGGRISGPDGDRWVGIMRDGGWMQVQHLATDRAAALPPQLDGREASALLPVCPAARVAAPAKRVWGLLTDPGAYGTLDGRGVGAGRAARPGARRTGCPPPLARLGTAVGCCDAHHGGRCRGAAPSAADVPAAGGRRAEHGVLHSAGPNRVPRPVRLRRRVPSRVEGAIAPGRTGADSGAQHRSLARQIEGRSRALRPVGRAAHRHRRPGG